jgi:hypothetical protein
MVEVMDAAQTTLVAIIRNTLTAAGYFYETMFAILPSSNYRNGNSF